MNISCIAVGWAVSIVLILGAMFLSIYDVITTDTQLIVTVLALVLQVLISASGRG
jgi:hypothetical protein